jgi:hypothetical protein
MRCDRVPGNGFSSASLFFPVKHIFVNTFLILLPLIISRKSSVADENTSHVTRHSTATYGAHIAATPKSLRPGQPHSALQQPHRRPLSLPPKWVASEPRPSSAPPRSSSSAITPSSASTSRSTSEHAMRLPSFLASGCGTRWAARLTLAICTDADPDCRIHYPSVRPSTPLWPEG